MTSDAATTTTIHRERRQATVAGHLDASPDEVFAVLADPAQHPSIDGSGMVVAAPGMNPDELGPGSRFFMLMRWTLVPYAVVNRVVEYERDRLIAWRHFAGHRWRWELEPEDEGTRVVHTFDWSTSHWPRVLELASFPERNAAGMSETLGRLADLVDGGP